MLDDHDAIDRWLRDEVVPVAVITQADPSRLRSIEDVFDEMRAFHATRRDASGGSVYSNRI